MKAARFEAARSASTTWRRRTPLSDRRSSASAPPMSADLHLALATGWACRKIGVIGHEAIGIVRTLDPTPRD